MHLEELEKCQCCTRLELCFHPRQSNRSFSSLKCWEKFPLWYIGRVPYIHEYLPTYKCTISLPLLKSRHKNSPPPTPCDVHMFTFMCLTCSCQEHLWMFRTSTNKHLEEVLHPTLKYLNHGMSKGTCGVL
jgi:hypothetical protein